MALSMEEMEQIRQGMEWEMAADEGAEEVEVVSSKPRRPRINTAIITIKTDPQTKSEFQKFTRELGLSTSAGINALIKQALRADQLRLFTRTPSEKYLIGFDRMDPLSWEGED